MMILEVRGVYLFSQLGYKKHIICDLGAYRPCRFIFLHWIVEASHLKFAFTRSFKNTVVLPCLCRGAKSAKNNGLLCEADGWAGGPERPV